MCVFISVRVILVCVWELYKHQPQHRLAHDMGYCYEDVVRFICSAAMAVMVRVEYVVDNRQKEEKKNEL